MFHNPYICLGSESGELADGMDIQLVHCRVVDLRSNNTNRRPVHPRMQERDYADSRLQSKFHNLQSYTRASHLFDGFVGNTI